MNQIQDKNMNARVQVGRRMYEGAPKVNPIGHRPNAGGMQKPRPNIPGQTRINQMNVKNADRYAAQKKEYALGSQRTVDILGKILAVCIFMLFFGLPLFFLNLTYQGIGFEKQYYFYLWTFLGVVVVITQGMLGEKIEIRRTTLDIPLGILWVTFVVATVLSVDKYHSFFGFFGNPVNGLISITASILAYYLIVSYISRERSAFIWWAITISGSIVVLWSFLATMRLVPDAVFKYISPSLTGSFTSLAIFLAMMLPLLILSFSFWESEIVGSIKKKLISAGLFIILTLDLLTLSALHGYVRWYVILIAVGLLLVFAISRIVKVSQTTTVMIITTFLITFFLWMWGQPIISRTTIQPEASIKYSLSFDIAREAIKNRPIFGSGPGTYGYNFSLYRPKDLNMSGQYDIRFYSDKGVFMESISTIGLVGAIVIVIIVLTYINTVIHTFVRLQDDHTKIISLGAFIASIVALIYGLFLAVDGVIILYGVLIAALVVGLLRNEASDGDKKLSLSIAASPQYALSFAFLSILLAVGVIFGFMTLGKMFVADFYAGKALSERGAGDFDGSTAFFNKAIFFNGQEGWYFTVIGQYALDLANIELAKPEGERSDDAVTNYVTVAAGAVGTGESLMPNDVLANETKGFVYENSGGFIPGALSSAVSAYERAKELEPQNPYLDIAVGKLKLVEAQTKAEDAIEEKTGLVNDAKTYFESAKEKTSFDYEGQNLSFFAPAHYYISVVEEALGNINESIDAMTLALQVTQVAGSQNQQQILSRQINYGFNLARLLQVRGTEDDMKNAERLLLQIIGVNDQEVNSYLSLGLLYERQGKRDEAVTEYKKILEILPDNDEKARENIQNLIDTVEQGGSNIDTKNNQNTAPDPTQENDENEVIVQEDNVKEVNMIIVGRGDVVDRANQGKNALAEGGYIADIREEDNAEYEGVMVMYNGNADRAEVRAIEDVLNDQFDNVTSERNDEEVNSYNNDIVVIIGTE